MMLLKECPKLGKRFLPSQSSIASELLRFYLDDFTLFKGFDMFSSKWPMHAGQCDSILFVYVDVQHWPKGSMGYPCVVSYFCQS